MTGRFRRARNILSVGVVAATLALLLVGCGTVGNGLSNGLGSSLVGAWLLGLSLLALLTGCGGGSSSSGEIDAGSASTASTTVASTPAPTPTSAPTPPPVTPVAVPTKLAFTVQPGKFAGKIEAATALTPAPRVALLDANGNVVTTATNAVTLSLGSNPAGAILFGTVTVHAVNGIAIFDNVFISKASAAFSLAASADGLQGVTSTTFTVAPLSFGYPAPQGVPLLGGYGTAAAQADFNGDQRLDIVVGTRGNNVVVLLNNGDGFVPSSVTVPAAPVAVAASDFNKDGRPDVLVGDSAGRLSVLLGNGDGTFAAARNIGTLPNFQGFPYRMDVGDLNGDGTPDIVGTNSNPQGISVMLGVGDGTFGPLTAYPVAGFTGDLKLGDFNGDGKLDVFTCHYTFPTASVWLGNGDGTLQAPVTSPLVVNARFAATADFNRDGRLDVALSPMVTTAGRPLAYLQGNGDGTFSAPVNLAPFAGDTITAADFNGDGIPDIAYGVFVDQFSGSPINTLLGNGDGTFRLNSTGAAGGSRPATLLTGDYDGDGHLDMVETARYSSFVGFLRGTGDGGFVHPTQLTLGGAQRFASTVDVNGDGKLDLVTSNGSGPNISVALGNGDGTFNTPVNYQSGSAPQGLVVVDVNGDGRLDVAVACSGTTSVFLGNGDGTFKAAINVTTPAIGLAVVAADVNADGRPDLVVNSLASPRISVLLGNGDGTFAVAASPSAALYLGGNPYGMVLTDLNADGKLDLAAASANGNMATWIGNGDGTFQAPVNYPSVNVGPAMVGMDVNGDGKMDLVAAGSTTAATVFLGNGDGTLKAPTFYGPGMGGGFLAVADINLDGTMDLVVASGTGPVQVLYGNTDGTFQAPIAFLLTLPTSLSVGDVNGDGKPDIVTASGPNPFVEIVLHL